MRIRINDQSIDFTLEDEKTLGEVVEGIEQWLNSSRMQICALSIDDRELSLEQQEDWSLIPLKKITELDVKARTSLESTYTHLQTVYQYFQSLSKAIKDDNLVKV